MKPTTRKLALFAHITTSVGWLGAVLGFFALSILGLISLDPRTSQSVYPALEFVTWLVIVPLSIASLITGLVESLGTEWGLFRHYWVVGKLGLNVVATVLLLLHTGPISRVAAAASEGTLAAGDLRDVRIRLIADAGAALMALLVATALSVFKPRGLTAYGRRMHVARFGTGATEVLADPARLRTLYIVSLITVVALFVLLHVFAGGHGGHQ